MSDRRFPVLAGILAAAMMMVSPISAHGDTASTERTGEQVQNPDDILKIRILGVDFDVPRKSAETLLFPDDRQIYGTDAVFTGRTEVRLVTSGHLTFGDRDFPPTTFKWSRERIARARDDAALARGYARFKEKYNTDISEPSGEGLML